MKIVRKRKTKSIGLYITIVSHDEYIGFMDGNIDNTILAFSL